MNVVMHKPQQLYNEKIGKHVVDLSQKDILTTNIWQILQASDATAAEPVEAPAELTYDAETLMADLKAMLYERGSMSVRGVAQVFRILDKNNNRKIDAAELEGGLRQMGINLVEEQVGVLIKHFDNDKSGQINLTEFLTAIRGELNEDRLSWIKAAYDKLDVNKDGLVKLDDIAKIFDVSATPEVSQSKVDPKEAYMQYMSMWDTQEADGIVTFDEFCDYYRDISAGIESDEMFAAMMKAAWKF